MQLGKTVAVLFRVFRLVLAQASGQSMLVIITYFMLSFIPAVTTLIMTCLYDQAEQFIHADEEIVLIYSSGLLLVLCYFTKEVLLLINDISQVSLKERVLRALELGIGKKTASLSLIEYEYQENLNLIKRAKRCVERNSFTQAFLSIIMISMNIVGTISLVGVLSTYHIAFIPITVCSVFPFFVARFVRGNAFYYMQVRQSSKVRRLDYYWRLLSDRSSVKEMKVMGFGSYLSSKLLECQRDIDEESWSETKKNALSLLCCDLLRVTGYGSSIGLALFLVSRGEISIGVFGACITALLSAQNQYKAFIIQFGDLPSQAAFCTDFFGFLDLPEQKESETLSLPFEKEISLINVSFRYPESQEDAVRSINLTIPRGAHVAIVGENGSGKTTLVKILLGIYRPTCGEVLIDGRDIESLNSNGFWGNFSMVSQKFMTYALDLRQNILISDVGKEISEDKILTILSDVGLEYLLSKGYSLETIIGREFGGNELSGGERQKLAIARLEKSSQILHVQTL